MKYHKIIFYTIKKAFRLIDRKTYIEKINKYVLSTTSKKELNKQCQIVCISDAKKNYSFLIRSKSDSVKQLQLKLYPEGVCKLYQEAVDEDNQVLKDIKSEFGQFGYYIHQYLIPSVDIDKYINGEISLLDRQGNLFDLKWYHRQIPAYSNFTKEWLVHLRKNKLFFSKRKFKFIIKNCSLSDIRALAEIFISKFPVLRNPVLFSERNMLMADNAFQTYKYLILESEKRITPFYLLDSRPGNVDNSLSKNMLIRNTFKHRIIFYRANLFCYSWDYYSLVPNGISDLIISYLHGKQKYLLMSHGYTGGHNNSVMISGIVRGKSDVVICSTNEEEINFKKLGHNNVIVTGYPRMDKWMIEDNEVFDVTGKYTLFFTFRRSLLHASIEEFEISQYVRNIVKIIGILSRKAGSEKIIYIFHNSISNAQRLILRKIINELTDSVVFIDNEDPVNFNNALASAKIFITDISSVGFDMGYKKNCIVIFYTNDSFLSGHYKVNDLFFNQVSKMGGFISDNRDAFSLLIGKLDDLPKNGNRLYPYHDAKNCCRVEKVIFKQLHK